MKRLIGFMAVLIIFIGTAIGQKNGYDRSASKQWVENLVEDEIATTSPTNTLGEVLTKGNDAGGILITNAGAGAKNGDLIRYEQYVLLMETGVLTKATADAATDTNAAQTTLIGDVQTDAGNNASTGSMNTAAGTANSATGSTHTTGIADLVTVTGNNSATGSAHTTSIAQLEIDTANNSATGQSTRVTAEAALPAAGGAMTGPIDMDGHSISNVGTNSILFVDGSRITVAGTNIWFVNSADETNLLSGYEDLDPRVTANNSGVSTLNTRTGNLDSKADKNENNIIINALRISVNGSLSVTPQADGFTDEYEDETGIDSGSGSNFLFEAGYYYNIAADQGIDLTENLAAYYKFDDDAANTTALDMMGDYDQAYQGGSNTSTFAVSGKLDGALEMDGSADFDSGKNLTVFPDSAFAGWVKVVGGLTHTLFEVGTAYDPYWRVDKSVTDQEVNLYYRTGGSSYLLVSSDSLNLNTNEWAFVAISITNSVDYAIWINGSNSTLTVDGQVGAPSGNITANFYLCASVDGGESRFIGTMDNYQFWTNRALSQAEVDFIYNDGSGTTNPIESEVFSDMEIVSINSWFADSEPDNGKLTLLIEDVSVGSTINTDIKGWISNNDGGDWDQVTLVKEADYSTGVDVYVGTNVFSGSDTQMVYKITTHNEKLFKIYGANLLWY